jgi:hypothetical protein
MSVVLELIKCLLEGRKLAILDQERKWLNLQLEIYDTQTSIRATLQNYMELSSTPALTSILHAVETNSIKESLALLHFD